MMHYVSHHTNSKLRVEQSTAPAVYSLMPNVR